MKTLGAKPTRSEASSDPSRARASRRGDVQRDRRARTTARRAVGGLRTARSLHCTAPATSVADARRARLTESHPRADTSHRVETSGCTPGTASRDTRSRSWDTPRGSQTCPRCSGKTSTANPTSRRAPPRIQGTRDAHSSFDRSSRERARVASERESPTTSTVDTQRSDRSDRSRTGFDTAPHSGTRRSSRAARR